MTQQERFSETYRDAKALLHITGAYTGKQSSVVALSQVNELYDENGVPEKDKVKQ